MILRDHDDRILSSTKRKYYVAYLRKLKSMNTIFSLNIGNTRSLFDTRFDLIFSVFFQNLQKIFDKIHMIVSETKEIITWHVFDKFLFFFNELIK